MKVRELLEELSKLDPESEVITEGCDCDGDVGSVDVRKGAWVYDSSGKLVYDIEAPIAYLMRSDDEED